MSILARHSRRVAEPQTYTGTTGAGDTEEGLETDEVDASQALGVGPGGPAVQGSWLLEGRVEELADAAFVGIGLRMEMWGPPSEVGG
jgi:hypothetical protein